MSTSKYLSHVQRGLANGDNGQQAAKKQKTECSPDCCCCDHSEPVPLHKKMTMRNLTGYKFQCHSKGIIFHGIAVHSQGLAQLEVMEEVYIGVHVKEQRWPEPASEREPTVIEKYNFWKNVKETPPYGVIAFVEKDKKDIPNIELWKTACVIELGRKMLVPGFVDTHTHAPQYRFAGCGHIPLLQWLEKYTFPTEDKFKNLEFSQKAYPKAVQRHIQAGTTTCCYFATINTPASLVLCDAIEAQGQRAFVGKVCMDRNSPAWYVETTEESLADNEFYYKEVLKRHNHLLKPIVTPRFVPSCSSELMHGLAKQAKEADLNIQSHLSENKEEIAWVRSLHPDCASYTQVYEKHGLLTPKTVMAHCVHLSDDEVEIMRKTDAGVSHCPNSNFSLQSGVMDARKLLNAGVKVGLGTDVAGGYSVSMLNAIRQTIIASTTTLFSENKETEPNPITYKEAFFLATQGGANVLALGDVIGSFQVGKEFDALVIDPLIPDSPFDVYDSDTVEDVFQKFLFCGDDRNIVEVYVSGDRILQRENLEHKSVIASCKVCRHQHK